MEFKLDRALETYAQRAPACFTHQVLPLFARRGTKSAVFYRLEAASNASKRMGHLGNPGHILFDGVELVERLAALVPPPRFHTVRYYVAARIM